MRFAIDERRALEILPGPLETLRLCAADESRESGGVLLGRVYEDQIVVEQATTPGRLDRAWKFGFMRSVPAAQDKVNKAWRESEGALIYLGEWHTHPEASPTPSGTDGSLIANMLRDSVMEIDFLFLIIGGTADLWVGVQSATGLRRLIQE